MNDTRRAAWASRAMPPGIGAITDGTVGGAGRQITTRKGEERALVVAVFPGPVIPSNNTSLMLKTTCDRALPCSTCIAPRLLASSFVLFCGWSSHWLPGKEKGAPHRCGAPFLGFAKSRKANLLVFDSIYICLFAMCVVVSSLICCSCRHLVPRFIGFPAPVAPPAAGSGMLAYVVGRAGRSSERHSSY
ncbi:hypothetical protein G1C97_2168 [Bifidobacterium sp. DSM 109959]|uniref:Uncharacterized protein n=1 Tax=Bifidobacterium olomucense TaxID=2675324 RepID=A0A7Y0HWG9_9BIFI|nr:hypothetical protein [Bifidobacterium sp. DSM 109959]